jgi:hypothetical protein
MTSARFTKEEEDVIEQALDSNDPALLRTSRELHGFAQSYNWDGGTDAMVEIIRHPLCDRGTALMIYWLAQPEDVKEMPGKSPELVRDAYDLIVEIEKRIQSNGFARQTIGYVPLDDSNVTDGTDDVLTPASSVIPEVMRRRSPGLRLIPPFTPDKVARCLNGDEQTELGRKLARAMEILSEVGHPVSARAEPGDVVRAISAAAVAFRDSMAGGEHRGLVQTFLLQTLWNEQLCRRGSWRWLMVDGWRDPDLFTKDLRWKGFFWDVHRVIEQSSGIWRWAFDRNSDNAGKPWDGQIVRRFEELRGGLSKRWAATGEFDVLPIDETWSFRV